MCPLCHPITSPEVSHSDILLFCFQKSPFKAYQQASAARVPRISLSALDKDRPYKLYAIYDSKTDKGDGKLIYMLDNNGKKIKAYLTLTAIANLGDSMEDFEKVIIAKKMPFIIFRGIQKDGAFELDFIDSGSFKSIRTLS